MVLRQEPQGLVVAEPAVLDVVRVDPGLIAEPVLGDQPLVVEIDRRDPAVLVVDGAQVEHHTGPVLRPARTPQHDVAGIGRLETLLHLCFVLAGSDPVVHGRCTQFFERVFVDAGQVPEIERVSLTAIEIDEPQFVGCVSIASYARPYLAHLHMTARRHVVRHRAGLAVSVACAGCRHEQPASSRRQRVTLERDVVAEVDRCRRKIGIDAVQAVFALALFLVLLLLRAELLVEALLVRGQYVEIILLGRVVGETYVRELLDEPCRWIEDKVLLVALEGDPAAVCHEPRVRFTGRGPRHLAQLVGAGDIDIAGILPGL